MQGGLWIFGALALSGTGAFGLAAVVPNDAVRPVQVRASDLSLAQAAHAHQHGAHAQASTGQTAPGDNPVLVNGAPPTADQLATMRQQANRILFWTQAERDANYPRMQALFPTRAVTPSPGARPLPTGPSIEPMLGGGDVLAKRMAGLNIAGLVVIRNGSIVLERYARGLKPDGEWPSFSVAKSFTSTLVGAAIRDGAIASVDDPVTRYLPELKGSAYDGVSIAQVLTMRSGVRWNENYADPASDVARMYTLNVPPGTDQTLAYLRTLPRAATPGSVWNYNTGETNLIGVLVQRATGKGLASYLTEKIWRPAGMESPAYWMVDGNGHEIGGCCLSASTRDFARFGLFMMAGGVAADGTAMLSDGWTRKATAPLVDIGRRGGFYGYQWWTAPTFYDARGIFGQRIHIDPKRKLVIAINANWPSAVDQDFEQRSEILINDITAVLDRP